MVSVCGDINNKNKIYNLSSIFSCMVGLYVLNSNDLFRSELVCVNFKIGYIEGY